VNVGESGAINELARRGFTDGFRVVHRILRPQDLVIRDVYRVCRSRQDPRAFEDSHSPPKHTDRCAWQHDARRL